MATEKSVLEKLIEQKSQLEARIQSEKIKAASQHRKDETRRKILVGSYCLEKYMKSGSFEKLITELNSFLFKDSDRALFGLAPREQKEAPTTVTTHP